MVEYLSFQTYGGDDFSAIANAHKYANEHNEPIKIIGSPVFRIHSIPYPIPICTNVDWGDATFIIDDRNLSNSQKKTYLFVVERSSESDTSLHKYINTNKKVYIRFGDNGDNGTYEQEISLSSPTIDYDIHESYPIDQEPLTIKGGHFTTIANNGPQLYDYYLRGIKVSRSNTTIQNLTYNITEEGLSSSPYSGFITIDGTYNVQIKDCVLQAHRTYYNGARPGEISGTPMGSYSIQIVNSIGTQLRNINQTNFHDEQAWGLLATSFCVDLSIDNSKINRFDAHCSVTNCAITNSSIGWQGIKAVGFGKLYISNCRLYSTCVLTLRYDYGAFWNGDVYIKDCVWTPYHLGTKNYIVNAINLGVHDFGYECGGPSLHIDGLLATDVDVIILQDYNKNLYNEQIYPYSPTKYLSIKDISAKSITIYENKDHFPNVKEEIEYRFDQSKVW